MSGDENERNRGVRQVVGTRKRATPKIRAMLDWLRIISDMGLHPGGSCVRRPRFAAHVGRLIRASAQPADRGHRLLAGGVLLRACLLGV